MFRGESLSNNSSAEVAENQLPREVARPRGQKPNRAVMAEKEASSPENRFLSLSHEELMQIQPEDLPREELRTFIAALEKTKGGYEKIAAANREKEAAVAHEKEIVAAAAHEKEATIAAEAEAAATLATEAANATATETAVNTITTEEFERTRAKVGEKAAQGLSIKQFLTKKVLPVALAAAVLIGGIASALAGLGAINKGGDQPGDEASPETPTEQVDQAQASGEAYEHHGIYDGYYETGEFMSANKSTPYDFANAAEVASVVGDDECEVMKTVAHNESEALADQLASIPDTVKAKYGVSLEFLGGKSILETENIIEHLSDEEYDKLIHQVDQIWDDAFTESVTLDGQYQNAFMRTSATGNERVTHENTELVSCTTQENGTAATKFYWTVDGNANSTRMGDVTAKISRDANGHIAQGEGMGSCTQIITEVGTFSFLYNGMDEIYEISYSPNSPSQPDTPTPAPTPEPTPTPTPTPTPVPGHPAKNVEAEIRNAGDRVDQQPLNEAVTPPTTLEQDLAPVQQAHEQVSSGDMAGTQAEIDTQRQVDEAAQAASNESTANAGKTAAERANMFANGDY